MQGEVAQVTRFKNVAACGVQSISLSKPAQEVLKFYVCHIRPACIVRGGSASNAQFNSQSSPLWVNFHGKLMKESKLGYFLTAYYQGKLNLQLSSDTCRALIETFAHQEQLAGRVSATEQAAITFTNNHSGRTKERYYLYHESKKQAKVGQSCMQRYLPPLAEQEEGGGVEEEQEERGDNGDFGQSVGNDIGSKHSAAATAPKAKWDEEELDFLRDCIEEVEAGYRDRGVLHPTLMRDCLRIILQDERARSIFHRRHILTSARLRAGYERLLKRAK